MTRWGVGPKLVCWSVVASAPILVAGRVWPGSLRIECVPRALTLGAGLLLLVLGVPLVVAATATLHRGFPKGPPPQDLWASFSRERRPKG